MIMETAKIFENGGSQAVRLPKRYRFSKDEVFIQKLGDVVMLIPKDKVWDTFLEGLESFSGDFLEDGRAQMTYLPRESI